MFDTPQNTYYIIASFALIVLGTLGGVLLYKLIGILHKINEIVSTAQEAVDRIERGVEDVAERALSLSSYARVISNVVQGAMTMYARRAGFPLDEDDEGEEVVVKRRRRTR